MDCGSLLPLCGGRSLLRVGRSNFARSFAPRRGQQAAHLHSGSHSALSLPKGRLPQSTGFAIAAHAFPSPPRAAR